MADHNFLVGTYDANTAILDECKAHIAEIILPSEPASQFDENDFITTSLIHTVINSALPEVSQIFEGQAYMYRFAKKGVCVLDTDYSSKIGTPIDDLSTLVTILNRFIESMGVPTTTEVFFSFPSASIASIYIKNMDIDLKSASDEEIEDYYAILCKLDESNLSDYDKEKILEYLSWLSSNKIPKYDPIRAFGNLFGDGRYEKEYVTLYEKIHPNEKEIVNTYISTYVKDSNKKIERVKYQIYTSEYRYNLIASMNSGEMTNDVYDPTNSDHYGSRQHSAVCFIAGKYDYLYRGDVEYVKGKEEQYRKIIEKNVSKGDYKKIAGSHEKLAKYLSEINSHGCGYAALVNTIFNYYLGKEDEFRETFGYDMYDKYGDLNYDLLLVDIYTSRKKPAKHESLNTDNQDDFASDFMIDHDVSSSASDHVNITPENYYEYVLNGYQVIVQLTNCKDFEYTKQYDSKYHAYVMSCTPYDGNGSPEGHAMTITGVTDDGRFIVSSWGDKYILDNNLNVNVTYTIVRYYD